MCGRGRPDGGWVPAFQGGHKGQDGREDLQGRGEDGSREGNTDRNVLGGGLVEGGFRFYLDEAQVVIDGRKDRNDGEERWSAGGGGVGC